MRPDVSVIIAAHNAETTVKRAVASCLLQPEVAEVVVVDDASSDNTSDAAVAADDGSGRLNVVRFENNRGPSAARNTGIDASHAPFIAVLDADDYFLPDRFAGLSLEQAEWDLVADNIAFLPQASDIGYRFAAANPPLARRRALALSEFVGRNVSRPNNPRGELGFLKPVMRRSTLRRLALRYDERLRLGEDFILYATALIRGARFELVNRCGYVALERSDSLSGSHRTQDLEALAAADAALLEELDRGDTHPNASMILREHLRSIQAKVDYRQFLDRKNQAGLFAAGLLLLQGTRRFGNVASGIIRDKTRRNVKPAAGSPRMLFDPMEFDEAPAV